MQFIDLGAQFSRIGDDVMSRVSAVLKSQKYIMGPEVIELEQKLANYVGVNHAFACSSGTDALVIALMSFDLTSKDAVFVPSFTFFASAESITLAGGATPVFVDSDASTFNMSPSSLRAAIERVLSEGQLRPRGIIAVDLFGQLSDYDAIGAIAEEYDLFVVEDAAQSFGATRQGRKAGSFGAVGATSFYPSKPLGCYGDGGAVFTNDESLADRIKSIRVHGQGSDKYDNVRIGLNARLDTVQAAVLLSKLSIFDSEVKMRQLIADRYAECLEGVVKTPSVSEGCTSVWAQYTIMCKDVAQRERVVNSLQLENVPVCIFYPIPIHLSTAYRQLGYKEGDCPNCENMANRVVSLPMHPYLTGEDVERVANIVKGSLL